MVVAKSDLRNATIPVNVWQLDTRAVDVVSVPWVHRLSLLLQLSELLSGVVNIDQTLKFLLVTLVTDAWVFQLTRVDRDSLVVGFD
jgi:hypothetical protein